jgi:hypothetical protein
MMIPTYDFCVPDKECVTTTDDPCELFKRINSPRMNFSRPATTSCWTRKIDTETVNGRRGL